MPPPASPFRLLNPAQYALLGDQEKRDYLVALRLDIHRRQDQFRADNRRIVQWLVDKGAMAGRK
jgi:hypothetical protein